MDKDQQEQPVISFLPGGKSCEKCGSSSNVRKFKGSMLCKGCRNQWAAIN